MNYRYTFTDFRIQVLESPAFVANPPAIGWHEYSKLFRHIQNCGRHNFLTRNVTKKGASTHHGETLGELNINIIDYNVSERSRLQYSFFGFKSPECDALKKSRLYYVLNDYIMRVVRPRPGTIFGYE